MGETRSVPTPHDRLVRRIFGRPATAAVLLRRVLPSSVLEWLDLSRIEVESTTHVGPSLGKRCSDLIYAVGVRGSTRSLRIFVTVEHQSSPDPLMPLRMYLYIGSLWERTLADAPSGTKTLPMVLPIVLVQCPHKWNGPNQLSELLEGPRPLRNALSGLIELELLLDDMTESVLDDPVAEPSIVALVELTRALMVSYHQPEWLTEARMQRLAPLFDVVLQHHRADAEALWAYVASVFAEGSPVRRMLLTRVSKENQQMFVSMKDSWLAEGRTEGRTEGLATAVLQILQHRNLAVDEAARQQILETRDEARLRGLLERAMGAMTLAQVFESSSAER